MDDREQLVQEIIERLLLILPDVIGNLMKSHATNAQLRDEFYLSNPEFKGHEDIVREIVSSVEVNNTLADYSTVLNLAKPKIEAAIKLKLKVFKSSSDIG